jgi:hypothetical protein
MLPSVADINVYDSLDEQVAVRHLAGKTLDEAEALFRDNALRYQEDLMFMGPVAFRFYVPAYVNYLRSAASSGDPDAVNCFVGLVRHRWEYEPEELRPVCDLLMDACRTVLAEWDRFGVDETIYSGLSEQGLRGDYEALIVSLTGSSGGR